VDAGSIPAASTTIPPSRLRGSYFPESISAPLDPGVRTSALAGQRTIRSLAATGFVAVTAGDRMKILPIVWQRLVNAEARTCPRCEGTGAAVVRALDRLAAALAPLGVEPRLETTELDETAFRARPLESNRIWIAGKPLEEWLEAKSGSSRCCNECGDNECRTVEVGSSTYEVIPEELLVRAGVIAASRLLDPTWAG
jgi:hypothetical protein